MTEQVDHSKLDIKALGRVLAIITAIFALFVLLVYIFGALPTTPNLLNRYDMDQWPAVQAQQVEQLSTSGTYEVEVEVVAEDGTKTTELVTRYRIPIEQAKALLVERGLPTRDMQPAE